MGTDKALLPDAEGRSVLECIQNSLSDFKEVLISSNQIKGAVPDVFRNCGPMGGIHAALCRCESGFLFCIPCDMPRFPREAVEFLLSRSGPESRAVICRDGSGRIHPACCIVSKSLIPLLEEHLRAEKYKLLDFFEDAGADVVDFSGFPDEIFFNMNTPEDYRRFLSGITDSGRN